MPTAVEDVSSGALDSNKSMFICFGGKRCHMKVQIPFLSQTCFCVFVLAATLGSLEFSLLYEQENHVLHCCIVKAKVNMYTRRDKLRRDEPR